MHTFYRYFLVLTACAALLLGVQAPNFVDQYEKRLDAHLIEVEGNLRGYREIADTFFAGSLRALLDKHEQSADAVFKAEAKPIRRLFERHQHFLQEKRALETGLIGKLAFIVAKGDRQLVHETWGSYSFTVPLNGAAVASGFIVMTLAVLIIELIRLSWHKLFGMPRRTQPVH